VHDADNHCFETIDAVEHNVIARDERPGVWCDLGACWAKLGMIGQALASGDDPVDEAVFSGRIVQRHVQPDVIEVSAGARRKDYAGHVSAIGRCVCRQTLTSPAFDIFGVQRLALAAVNALSPEQP